MKIQAIPRRSGGGFLVFFENGNQETARMIKALAVGLLVEMGYQFTSIIVSEIQREGDAFFFGIKSLERLISPRDIRLALEEATGVVSPPVAKHKER